MRTTTTLLAITLVLLLTAGVAPGATVRGTSGNDTLRGANGPDTMRGYAGSDTMSGGYGRDRMYGGNDAMRGNHHGATGTGCTEDPVPT